MTPITFPHTFRADNIYRWASSVMGVMGLLAILWMLTHHELHPAQLIALPWLVFAGACVIVMSLRIDVNADGIIQHHLSRRKSVAWSEIVRLDKSRGAIAVYDQDGRDLLLLSLLSQAAQQALADEIIARAGLRPSATNPAYPVTAQWTR